MRFRRLGPISALALAALVLAGCSGATEPDATESAAPAPSSSTAPVVDLCTSVPLPGDASDAVTIEGEVGTEPVATFATPLEVTTVERTVYTEGAGAPISEGDYVTYGLTVFDAVTGDKLQSAGYGDQAVAPIPISVGQGSDFFGCATEGSRVVMTFPPTSDGATAAQVAVLDVLGVTPEAAWCAADTSTEGMPAVEFDADGAPTVTIPATDPIDVVRINVLTEGDGAVVQSGDSVTLNYTGVKWSDNSVFDSSWERGEPLALTTTGVVTGFQRALEGQKVGSTVLVSMPPACGYGEVGTTGNALEGETLVFVVEILETASAPKQ